MTVANESWATVRAMGSAFAAPMGACGRDDEDCGARGLTNADDTLSITIAGSPGRRVAGPVCAFAFGRERARVAGPRPPAVLLA